MGFIKDTNIDVCDINLSVYWTDKGKGYLSSILKGRKTGMKATYFSLGDSDTNYNQSTNPDNILRTNFIPDISGTEPNCLDGTKHNNIKYLINHLPQNLIKTKRYLVNLIDNTTVNSTISCVESSLIYNLYFNGENVFTNDKRYSVYTGKDLIFNNKAEIDSYVLTNITNNIKAKYQNNITVITGIQTNSNNTYSIKNIAFTIITETLTDQVADNSINICNNNLTTEIKYETIITSDPNPRHIVNLSSKTSIIGCGEPVITVKDCSSYYGISAYSFDDDVNTIIDCIVSNFDGWI
jgi:hypothetical protein